VKSKYIRVSNGLNDFGKLVPESDLRDKKKIEEMLAASPNSDWYHSLYYYGDDVLNYFKTNGESIKGYQGQALTDKLTFDFDSKVDINQAKDDVKVLLDEFVKQGIDVQKSIQVFFSGNKGFHLELTTNRTFTPEEQKDIAGHIKKLFKLATLDMSLYNLTRIYRMNNTINQKSGLYKIEIDPIDVYELSIDQIKELAKKPKDSTFIPEPTDKLNFIKAYQVMFADKPKSIKVESSEEIEGIRGLDTIDFSECPRTMPRCIFALSKGVMQAGAGERNALFLRLASYYRNNHMSKEVALGALVGVAELNANLYPDADPYTKAELENTVINSVFGSKAFKLIAGASGTSPDNELLKKYCDAVGLKTNKKCCLHHRSENETSTVQIDSVSDSFEDFAANFDKNTVKTGILHIDDNMNIAKGTTTLLVGATGSGKTTLALNIMENANALKQNTMFFSLDMHKNLVYLKLAQKVTNYTQTEILTFYKTKNVGRIAELRKAISDRYGMTFFDFSTTLTQEQMRDKIFKVQDDTGKSVDLVVVDYAGRVTGPYSDTFANANYNALKSTEIANVTDSAWIYLSQISRGVGDGVTPLRSKRVAKESGTWEESASNVITMWRPFMGDPDRDDVVRLFLAKNRMGKELETILKFDGEKGIIRDMTFDELADYSSLREKEEREYHRNRMNKS